MYYYYYVLLTFFSIINIFYYCRSYFNDGPSLRCDGHTDTHMTGSSAIGSVKLANGSVNPANGKPLVGGH